MHSIIAGEHAHGCSRYPGSFEFKKDAHTAEVTAAAINATVLQALSIDVQDAKQDPAIPRGQVACWTSNTTVVSPATAKVLARDYKLFDGLLWNECADHKLGLYLKDQAKLGAARTCSAQAAALQAFSKVAQAINR